jgi:hypothetical protein
MMLTIITIPVGCFIERQLLEKRFGAALGRKLDERHDAQTDKTLTSFFAWIHGRRNALTECEGYNQRSLLIPSFNAGNRRFTSHPTSFLSQESEHARYHSVGVTDSPPNLEKFYRC